MAYRDFPSGVDDRGRRLDRVARRLLPGAKLGEVYAHIRKGRIRVNGRKRASGYRICEGDALQIDESMVSSIDDWPAGGRRKPDLRLGSLEKAIVFENEHLLCINKPRGIDVHGRNSVDSWVGDYVKRGKPRSLSFRPGPVHRIDRNTTGVVFFGKSTWAQRRMSEYMRAGSPKKIYVAVLDGSMRSPTVWHDTLYRDEQSRKSRGRAFGFELPRSHRGRTSKHTGRPTAGAAGKGLSARGRGQDAVTGVYPIFWTDEATLALCVIRSGKTHQIRAQAARHGHPLSGDAKYEGSHDPRGYMLHALAFLLPEYDRDLGLRCAYAEPPEEALERISYRFGTIELERILESVDQAAATV